MLWSWIVSAALQLAPTAVVLRPHIELRPGEPVPVELAAGAGPTDTPRTFAFTPDFAGGAYVRASSSDLQVSLAILGKAGEVLQLCDGSKSPTTPLLFALLEPGRELVVRVASAAPEQSGRCTLLLEVARETEATDQAVALARTALTEVQALAARRDLEGARALLEEAIGELRAADEGAQSARVILALGDLARNAFELHAYPAAAEAMSRVLAFRRRTLPDDHLDLQRERSRVAAIHHLRGNLHEALSIQREILAACERTLPEEHADRLLAEWNLGATLSELGELNEALRLTQHVVEVRTRTLHEEDAELLGAQENLAAILRNLGQLHAALEVEEHVLAVHARKGADDDLELQDARQGLALTLNALGEYECARELQERVLEAFEATLPEDDSQLLWAKGNLASTLKVVGDLDGARSLEEQVLAVRSRTLPDDHPSLQWARANLAATLHLQGDYQGSLLLSRKVLAVRSQALPEDHLDLQTAREHIAISLHAIGDLDQARQLQEQILEVRLRKLSADHKDVQAARINLATTLSSLGRSSAAKELREEALASYERTFPRDHPFSLLARRQLLWTSAAAGDREAVKRHGLELARGLRRSSRRSACLDSPRQVEARALDNADAVDSLLSIAGGTGPLEPFPELDEEAFATLETIRGLGLLGASFVRGAMADPANEERRAELLEAGRRIAALSGPDADRELLGGAVRERDVLQRRLLETVLERGRAAMPEIEPGTGVLAAALADDVALVSYWRYRRARLDPARPEDLDATPSMVAFVVRRGAALARIELGPAEPIEAAIEVWRSSLGAPLAARGQRGIGVRGEGSENSRAEGERVRALVLDPVLPVTGSAKRLVVVLDDALHLVPLDGLPLGEGAVGDRIEIQVRTTLWELLARPPGPSAARALVAFGGIDYGAPPTGSESTAAAAQPASFPALAASGAEVEAIAQLAAERGIEAVHVLGGERATKSRLAELSSGARYLHLATHGYFGLLDKGLPEVAPDPRPIDARTGLGSFLPGPTLVSRLSPMALCGLALSAANRPAGGDPTQGLLTAEELATFDLSGCELAVLSACDTSVGLRSAGQGVASLQKAMHMAGARSAVTSLWKVPDEATQELMADFYRRIWSAGEPLSRALWNAKASLRAKGHPERDWAGWVLTGAPE